MSRRRQDKYTIDRSPATPLPLEIYPWRFKMSIVFAWSTWTLFMLLQYRIASLIQSTVPYIIWQMWLALLTEFCLTFQDAATALNFALALFSVEDTVPRPSYSLRGDVAPSIDVLVTCCGEAIDVIVNTIAAAASQDYPRGQLRVFLLDDGQDERLRQATGTLNTRLADQGKPQITYLSRKVEKGARSFFKAGNLRFGISESLRLGSSEFLAGLDADMIPMHDWLRKMIPHLLLNDKLALACPPQRYYNLPSNDPLGQQADFDMFFTIQEALNDRLGAAMCTGSGYVVRRDSLAQIGGWPLAETGEDFMCSALLSNAGWEIAFVREHLQAGLAPENLRVVVKQRMRWIDACMEVCQHFGYYLPGSAMTSQMTASQRAVNIMYALRDYSPVTTSLALVLLPIALWPTDMTRLTMVTWEHQTALFWSNISFLVMFGAHKLNNFIMYKHIGLSKVANMKSHEVWIAPFMASRNLVSLLPASLRTSTFAVCGALKSPANERSQRYRQPLPYRMLTPDMALYTIYAIYASIPLLLQIQNYRTEENVPQLAWMFPAATVKLLGCVWKVLVPVRYMLWPPTVPERDQLVEADEMGVKRPKKDWEKDPKGNGIWWMSLGVCEICVLLLCVMR